MQTQARVTTPHGDIYVKKLCRHFGHKVPVQIAATKARIDFPFGACQIAFDEKQVEFNMEVANTADLDKAEQVVTDHFLRMANKDNPEVRWNRVCTSSTA